MPTIILDLDVQAGWETAYKKHTPEPLVPSLQCLFCSRISGNLDANLSHMQKKHGLFIPSSIDNGEQQLIVDLATLVEYLNLVIFKDCECLFCHTQKQSPLAVQHHMMSKGHCRIDLDEGASQSNEFRDFYEPVTEDEDVEASSDSVPDDDLRDITTAARKPRRPQPLQINDESLLLPCGKVLSSRSANVPRVRHWSFPEPNIHCRDRFPFCSRFPTPLPANVKQRATLAPSLTRAERRLLAGKNNSHLAVGLAKLKPHVRWIFFHLFPDAQRCMETLQFKKQERRQEAAERRIQGKLYPWDGQDPETSMKRMCKNTKLTCVFYQVERKQNST